jgi:hypothetical protein
MTDPSVTDCIVALDEKDAGNTALRRHLADLLVAVGVYDDLLEYMRARRVVT